MRRWCSLGLVLSTGCAAPGGGDVLAGQPEVHRDDLLEGLEALQAVADAHGGNRALGTAGYDASVQLVVDRLDRLGLDARVEPFDVEAWTADVLAVRWDGGGLDEVGAMTGSIAGLATGLPVGVDLRIPPDGRSNTSTSGCEAADYAGFPAGAVAVVQRGTCTFTDKARLAEAAGAVAVVIGNEGQSDRRDTVEGALAADPPPGLPVVGVSYEAMLALLDVAVPVTVEVVGGARVVPSANVLVDLPGQEAGTWVVGAHLDSVPEGPGIDDDGTGVVALLQLAEVLVAAGPGRHGVRLGFWGAEEVGLVGSRRYVEGLDDADVAELLGDVNVDMIGSPNPGRFVYDGAEAALPEDVRAGSTALQARFEAWFAARDLPTAPVAVGGRSDHASFAAVGLPTTGLFTGAEAVMGDADAERFGGEAGAPFDPCYHRACDRVENVDLDALEEMARALVGVVVELRESGPPPR